MSFFKKLFGSSENEKQQKSETELPDKKNFKIYPRIKNREWDALPITYHIPLGGDLVLVFIQDINERITYLMDDEIDSPEIKQQIKQWKENINEVPFELFSSESWESRVYFNQPGDYSNEKVFDPAFIRKACELLKTDKLIISVSRRHRMQLTSYHEDFQLLERFFFNHFSVWRDSGLVDEVISEMVLIAEKDRVTHIVPMGFRMNLYEKDGKKILDYSTTEDLGDKIDFQQIIEKNKIAVNQDILENE